MTKHLSTNHNICLMVYAQCFDQRVRTNGGVLYSNFLIKLLTYFLRPDKFISKLIKKPEVERLSRSAAND